VQLEASILTIKILIEAEKKKIKMKIMRVEGRSPRPLSERSERVVLYVLEEGVRNS
jgi:hypothetical protein